eukprot:7401308-Ditylum_brightwellii.AAC.2
MSRTKTENDDKDNDTESQGNNNDTFESHQFFGFQTRKIKIDKLIEDTRYVDEVKMYAKKNQESSIVTKDELVYIDIKSNTVGIGGYDNYHTIKANIKIDNGITATSLLDKEYVLLQRDDILVPLNLNEGIMTLNIRKLSTFELSTYEVIEITKDEVWDPLLYSEDMIDENAYDQLVSEFEDKQNMNVKLISRNEKRDSIKNHSVHFLHPREQA